MDENRNPHDLSGCQILSSVRVDKCAAPLRGLSLFLRARYRREDARQKCSGLIPFNFFRRREIIFRVLTRQNAFSFAASARDRDDALSKTQRNARKQILKSDSLS